VPARHQARHVGAALEQGGEGEWHSKARAGEREHQHRGRRQVASSRALVEGEQAGQAGGDRSKVADLKWPEQVLPGATQKDQQDRRQEGKHRPDPAPGDHEQEHATGQVESDEGGAVGAVVPEPDQRKEDPVNGDRHRAPVPAMRSKEGVEPARPALEDEVPLVVEKRRAATNLIDQDAAGHERRNQDRGGHPARQARDTDAVDDATGRPGGSNSDRPYN